MKSLILGTLLGAICIASAAQTPTPLGEVKISGAQQRIQLPEQPYRMWESDFRGFKGNYKLENGQTLYLSSMGRRMFATMEGQAPAEIIAASPSNFVAANQQMDLAFFPETGAVTDVRLRMLVPRDQASLEPRVVTLFAHR